MSRLPLCRLCRLRRTNGVRFWCKTCCAAFDRWHRSARNDGTHLSIILWAADRAHLSRARRR